MLLLETTIFYLLLGIGVAVAVYVRSDEQPGLALAFQLAGACLFWPLFVPMLLTSGEQPSGEPAATERPSADEPDALATAIGQVEAELDAALDGLDGWAEDVLSSEAQRLAELRTAWKLQAERIRQLDHLLAQPTALGDSLAAVGADVHRAQRSESLRQENLRQLRELRNKLHADLVGTLAWVRELVTMIHLARFSGAPAARAEELVAQIAAAVQGLSEVSAWREEDEPAHAGS